MAHPRLLIACSLLWGCEPSAVVGYGEFDPDAPEPVVYEVKEWRFEPGTPPGNPFAHYVAVEVWRGDVRYKIDGFYDGLDGDRDQVWRARFMPTEPGAWNYTWSSGGRSNSGVLDVQAQRGANHGHVHLDPPTPTTPSVLRHDDHTLHYWFGGKAFTARNYGLPAKDQQQNRNPPDQPGYDAHFTDKEFKEYLDLMQETGHNGTRLKIGLYPLADDGLTWDLPWIRRAEQWIRWMQQRNIYCQITLFDSKARKRNTWFEAADDPQQHPLNAWQVSQTEDERAAKENYIRYIVARFAAYSNVYWELVDHVDAFGTEAGDTFVALANEHYLKSLREYDPYDLPIGADARRASLMSPLDIEFSGGLTLSPSRVAVLNEVADSCPGRTNVPTPAQADVTIRDEVNRQCYRIALWRSFVSGGFGANEASWLDLSQLPNSAVVNVMRDHERLRSIVTTLSVGLDQLVPDPGFVESTTQPVGTRAKPGQLYVAYFLFKPENDPVAVRLPAGDYTYCWLDPKAATTEAATTGTATTGTATTGAATTGATTTGATVTGPTTTGTATTGATNAGAANGSESASERPQTVSAVTASAVPLRLPSVGGDRLLLVERYVDGKPASNGLCLATFDSDTQIQ